MTMTLPCNFEWIWMTKLTNAGCFSASSSISQSNFYLIFINLLLHRLTERKIQMIHIDLFSDLQASQISPIPSQGNTVPFCLFKNESPPPGSVQIAKKNRTSHFVNLSFRDILTEWLVMLYSTVQYYVTAGLMRSLRTLFFFFFFFRAALGELINEGFPFPSFLAVSCHRSCYFVVVGASWLMTPVLTARFSNFPGTLTIPFFFFF
jgi:hypothetical protein